MTTTNETARTMIQRLLTGHAPNGTTPEQCGAWADIVRALTDAYTRDGTSGVRQLFETLSRMHPDLARLIANHAGTATLSNTEHDGLPDFALLDAQEISVLTPPTFLVKHTLVLGETTVIAGPGDSGKTFLVTDLCWKVAQYYPTCYVAAEDAQGISLRMRAWCRHHHRPYPDKFFMLGSGTERTPCAVQLMDHRQIGKLISTLTAAHVRLVIIDTLSQCSGGADENGSDMTRLAAACNRIAHETGAAVVVIHHTTKDGKHYRGHSSLKDNTYGFFDVTKEDDVISLTKVRVKNTGDIPDRHFRFVTIDLGQVDTYGEPITSAVALPAHKVIPATTGLRRSEHLVLSQIALMNDADGPPRTTQIVRSLKDEVRERACYNALKLLRERGLVTKEMGTFTVTDKGRQALAEDGGPDTPLPHLIDAEPFEVTRDLPPYDPDPPTGGPSSPPSSPPPTSGGPPVGGPFPSCNGSAPALHADPPTSPPAAVTTTPPPAPGMTTPVLPEPDRTTITDAPIADCSAAAGGHADLLDNPVPTQEPASALSRVPMDDSAEICTNCTPTAHAAHAADHPHCTALHTASQRQCSAAVMQCRQDEIVDGTNATPLTEVVPSQSCDADTHAAIVPPEIPTSDLPRPEIPASIQARSVLCRVAELVHQAVPEEQVRALGCGLADEIRHLVQEGIDWMLQARLTGQVSIAVALQMSLDRLCPSGDQP
jgi:hypothetical protein